MYAIRRWWDKNGVRVGILLLAVGGVWVIRQTQGSLLFELYRGLSLPFAPQAAPADPIADARARELQQKIIELQSQNQQLQELLGYVQKRNGAGIVAPVIGRSADHWWQQIIVGRGGRDGVAAGAVVSGEGGVIGRVVQVTPNTSRVLLISDPTSQVGVVVSRSRSMGYVRGQSANRVVMEFFDKVPDVRPGDVVATSAYSQLFPPGLPLGVVESVNLNKSPAPEAVVALSAPVSHLEWVTLSPNPKSESNNAPPELQSRGESDRASVKAELANAEAGGQGF
ncbi:rod shape-determining protein MreC [Leptolyngbya sp. FACHB-711]|uniref:rod shape-determining protein MreC n=1 Tax=unclassified Leptolyngbya TaxID=2650499 RepID=UPI00168896C3|nr:rod shape-determining protein MreC [Leptolyngbya sp. FACHB-711]MBD1851390.1 rod shape-determining protein MreC [Cyanobacteria bacterium FACHB-502]MBD2023288.1 rod shape-determining protein MreC [Leptolyngbya sp. FACHB-711]